MVESIATDVYDGGEGNADFFVCGRNAGDEPIDDFVVREREDEFVHYAVYAYGSGNELEVGVGGVIEDEMVAVEGG